MNLYKKQQISQRRRWRVRKKVAGTAARPRLTVRFSQKHVYAQLVDDRAGATLASASSVAKDVRAEKLKPNSAGAKVMGKRVAEAARAAGISSVVFDRGGRRYHGCIKVFADAAREAGLQF